MARTSGAPMAVAVRPCVREGEAGLDDLGPGPVRRCRCGSAAGLRQLASGRWRTRCIGPVGERYTAREASETTSDAQDRLNLTRADNARNHWRAPDAGAVNCETPAPRWTQAPGPAHHRPLRRPAAPAHPADLRRRGPGRQRVGKRGASAYLEAAAQRQNERDDLDELIGDFGQVHGSADPAAVAAERARLTGGTSDAGAAV